MQRRSRDLAHPLRGWRLDQLRPAAQDQLVTDALRAALPRGDMLSQPPGQRLGIRDAALPKTGVGANLRAMALRCAARKVKRPQLGRRHADLAGQVRHRIVGDFMQRAREPSTPEQELEQDGKTEPGRTGLVAQLIQLVADQREMIDDVIEAHLARHRQRPSGSCSMLVIMPDPSRCRAPATDRADPGRPRRARDPDRPTVTQPRSRTICMTYNRERVM
jgi:hypothetical protein